jgi:DNA-binding LacI/PurR family transcriptional regulator
MQKKSVTLKTIAEELNLSVTAVSRALKDGGNISDRTKERVRQAVQRLNYQPNAIAESLRCSRTKTLGLVISDSSLSFFGMLIEGIEGVASQSGYNIILSHAGGNRLREMEAVRSLAGKRIDGLLLAASTLTAPHYREFLESFGIPYMFLVRSPDYPADYIINDNCYGVYEMMKYLIHTGSRKIYLINVSSEISSSRYRRKGYEDALREEGIAADETWICEAAPTMEAGYQAMKAIFARDAAADAVYCGCDLIAIGVMECIFERGLRVPQDVRVASYDDIEFAAYLKVPLTTVRQPKFMIGELGARMMIDKLSGESGKPIHIVLKPELILRQST